jgi:protein phosphatase 1 regulatory subunit 7
MSRDLPRDSKGWDGKLRIDKEEDPQADDQAEETDAQSSDESDAEAPTTATTPLPTPHITTTNTSATAKQKAQITSVTEVPGYAIPADEDLLSDIAPDETDIDLNHARISSLAPLQLSRFTQLTRLCLRQNELSKIDFPEDWESAKTMVELDLYDNAIGHIKGLEQFENLEILDLSFNQIKHIKRLDHMKKLKDIYFVQNKISRIEGLEALTSLTNLELGANRIRVCWKLEMCWTRRDIDADKSRKLRISTHWST